MPLSSECRPPTPDVSGGNLMVVDYVVRAQWSNTYIVDVTATLNCAAARRRSERFGVANWDLEFTLLAGHRISRFWNAAVHQDGDDVQGNRVKVSHNKFSSPVRGKAILYFGFEVNIEPGADHHPSIPSTMIVNSQVCEVDAYFARELADCAFDYIAEQSRSPSPSPASSRESSPGPPVRRCKSAPPVMQIAPFQFLHFNVQTDRFPQADVGYHPSSEAASEASTPLDEGHQPSDITNLPKGTDVRCEVDSGCTDPSSCLTECVSQIRTSDLSADESSAPSSLLGKRKVPEGDSSVSDKIVSDLIQSNEMQRESPALITGATRTLKLDYYRRSEQLKKRKYRHMDWVDTTCKSREKLVLDTVLMDSDIILEPNMFPYDTPQYVSHWTLWSRRWLKDEEIELFVCPWLQRNMPHAVEWNFDDNMSDGLSINLFHVHVYIRCDLVDDRA